MANYTVELNYNARIVVDVDAENEGDALGKAREIAEIAPMSSFNITEEERGRILNVN